MDYRVAFLAPLFLWLGTGTTTRQAPPIDPPRAVAPRSDAEEYAAVNNAFGLKLFAELRAKDGNVLFSPYGLTTALAVPYAGSRGDTAEQMRRAVGFPEQDRLYAAQRAWADALAPAKRGRQFELSSASGLWTQTPFRVEKDFALKLRDSLDVQVAGLDMAGNPEAAAREVNEWVAGRTRNMIRTVVTPDALGSSRSLLVSAACLKAGWEYPFEKVFTAKAPFRTRGGGAVETDYLKQTAELDYGEEKGVQFVSLPYRGGLRMFVVLPRTTDGLGAVEPTLTPANLARWSGELRPHNVELSLPKVRIAVDTELCAPLAALGLSAAFTKDANFSGFGDAAGVHLGPVVHRAWVAFHEAGTDAAAATISPLGTTSVPEPKPKAEVVADRPFVFLIQDVKTGTILFLGRVADPRR